MFQLQLTVCWVQSQRAKVTRKYQSGSPKHDDSLLKDPLIKTF